MRRINFLLPFPLIYSASLHSLVYWKSSFWKVVSWKMPAAISTPFVMLWFGLCWISTNVLNYFFLIFQRSRIFRKSEWSPLQVSGRSGTNQNALFWWLDRSRQNSRHMIERSFQVGNKKLRDIFTLTLVGRKGQRKFIDSLLINLERYSQKFCPDEWLFCLSFCIKRSI